MPGAGAGDATAETHVELCGEETWSHWLCACTEQGNLLGIKRQIQKLRHVYITSFYPHSTL